MTLTSQYPEEAEKIDVIMNTALKESIKLDDVIKVLLPVYRKHFTIEEIQELNRFSSTEIMQNMLKKMPLVTQEAAPLQVELFQDFQKRFQARIEEIIED